MRATTAVHAQVTTYARDNSTKSVTFFTTVVSSLMLPLKWPWRSLDKRTSLTWYLASTQQQRRINIAKQRTNKLANERTNPAQRAVFGAQKIDRGTHCRRTGQLL